MQLNLAGQANVVLRIVHVIARIRERDQLTLLVVQRLLFDDSATSIKDGDAILFSIDARAAADHLHTTAGLWSWLRV